MKAILFIIALTLPLLLSGQVPDAQTLVGLHTVTTAERNAITGAGEGMLIFDTDEESVYVYTTSFGWRKFQSAPNTYTGSFTISAPGAISVAGLPFEPSHINFSAHANIESNNIDSDNAIGNNATNLYNSFGNMNGFAKDENGSIVQLVIYSGASGNSVNDISRYSSDSNCIGIRYSSQNGDDLGKILASLTSFNTDGFTLNTTYESGTLTVVNNNNAAANIDPDEVLNESIVVIYTAYR